MGAGLVETLNARKQQLQSELTKVERRLYEAETEYFTGEYTQLGNIFRGFDGFMSSKDTLRRRAKTFKLEDRLFSLSSRTSPAAKEEIKEEVALVKGKGKSKGMKRSRSARDAGNPQSHKKKK